MERLKKTKPPRIGLYSFGLKVYWEQFPNMPGRIKGYNGFIEERLSEYAEVFNFGIVDTEQRAREAGEYFNSQNVDLVFAHSATYATSSCILPVHQINKAPVVILNLQPAPEMDYDRTHTGEWLLQCVGCPIPEVVNTFRRAGVRAWTVNGLLGLTETPEGALADEATATRPEAIKAWEEIRDWALAAGVKRTLAHANFGFLGGYYSGMLDMYSDFTVLQAQTGMNIQILEMCDLEKFLKEVKEEDIFKMRSQVEDFFDISEDSPADKIARRPRSEQLDWACTVAAAQHKMARAYDLDALAYYYHGRDGNLYEKIQSGFIVGHSLLTAAGIPCAGEGDIKTALAMKICDTLEVGGSYCEIVAGDFNRNTIILGHDGPFHFKISKGRPILRGMGVYHGKRGSGVSVEAKVLTGDVTTLGVIQEADGSLKMIISEGLATDAPILQIGNTATHVEFPLPPAEYMDRWFAQAPTHHLALSVGHNSGLLTKVARLLELSFVTV